MIGGDLISNGFGQKREGGREGGGSFRERGHTHIMKSLSVVAYS